MKRSLGASERIRQAVGLLVLVGVAVIALGLDTRVLAKFSTAQTAGIETGLAKKLGLGKDMAESAATTDRNGRLVLPVEGQMPPLEGLGPWINSPPLTAEQLRGKVVLIDFWTYSCINCLRTLPYLKAWNERYAKDGLVIIGVHAPEFAFERDPANVRKAVADLGIRYPVALDNATWSGTRSRTATGRRITSSMPRGGFAITITARASTICPNASSGSCSPRPVTRLPVR